MTGAVRIQVQNDVVLASPVDHQIFFIPLGARGPAEYASAASFLFLNVLVAPRTPQVVHKLGNADELWEFSPPEGGRWQPASPRLAVGLAEVFTRSFSSLLGLK
jgi:hypothetical protein